jgi:hypothetical protein
VSFKFHGLDQREYPPWRIESRYAHPGIYIMDADLASSFCGTFPCVCVKYRGHESTAEFNEVIFEKANPDTMFHKACERSHILGAVDLWLVGRIIVNRSQKSAVVQIFEDSSRDPSRWDQIRVFFPVGTKSSFRTEDLRDLQGKRT